MRASAAGRPRTTARRPTTIAAHDPKLQQAKEDSQAGVEAAEKPLSGALSKAVSRRGAKRVTTEAPAPRVDAPDEAAPEGQVPGQQEEKKQRAKRSTTGQPPRSTAAAPAAGGRGGKPKAGGPTRAMEQQLRADGCVAVGGADEAGRGPLAGPVVAAVVVLPCPQAHPDYELPELLNDSKAMDEQGREAVYEQLTTDPRVKWGVAVLDHKEIDRINILQAALGGMRQAACSLLQQHGPACAPAPALDFLLVDGNRMPRDLPVPARTVVKGDATVSCIAAASVIAKVTRDRLMLQLDAQYPGYGFAQHKGYGVPAHMDAIARLGPCAVHRRSFEPVKGLTGWSREAQLAEEAEAAGGAAEAQAAGGKAQAAGKKAGPKGRAKGKGACAGAAEEQHAAVGMELAPDSAPAAGGGAERQLAGGTGRAPRGRAATAREPREDGEQPVEQPVEQPQRTGTKVARKARAAADAEQQQQPRGGKRSRA